MPVFRGTIKKESGTVYLFEPSWTNVYHISAVNGDIAMVSLVGAANAEAATYDENIFITELQVSTPGVPGATVTEQANIQGALTSVGDVLPPWNVARILFSTTDGGRPCIKYLRCGPKETDVAGQLWVPTFLGLLSDYATAVATDGAFCDPSGSLLEPGGGSVRPFVAMRQTRWSRRARPGFHRGYVPN